MKALRQRSESHSHGCPYCDRGGCELCDDTGVRVTTIMQIDTPPNCVKDATVRIHGSKPLDAESEAAIAELIQATFERMKRDGP